MSQIKLCSLYFSFEMLVFYAVSISHASHSKLTKHTDLEASKVDSWSRFFVLFFQLKTTGEKNKHKEDRIR